MVLLFNPKYLNSTSPAHRRRPCPLQPSPGRTPYARAAEDAGPRRACGLGLQLCKPRRGRLAAPAQSGNTRRPVRSGRGPPVAALRCAMPPTQADRQAAAARPATCHQRGRPRPAVAHIPLASRHGPHAATAMLRPRAARLPTSPAERRPGAGVGAGEPRRLSSSRGSRGGHCRESPRTFPPFLCVSV